MSQMLKWQFLAVEKIVAIIPVPAAAPKVEAKKAGKPAKQAGLMRAY